MPEQGDPDAGCWAQAEDMTMDALRREFAADFVDLRGLHAPAPGTREWRLWEILERDAPFTWWTMGFAPGSESGWRN